MKAVRIRPSGGLALSVALGLGMSGCAMTEGLEASGTLDLVITTSAANDVLLEQGFRIQTAPVCEPVSPSQAATEPAITVRCAGLTRSGRPITVSVTEGKDMTIAVSGQQIYQGSVDEILQRNLSAGEPADPSS